jgi:diguanylate cyclase (GGDEF)-like protein
MAAAKRPSNKDSMVRGDRVRTNTAVTRVSRIPDETPAQQACLVVIHGSGLGRKYVLASNTLVVGRSAKSDIQIDQESVSRAHSHFMPTGKSVYVRDLGSTNGTFVNDEAVKERVLRDGDQVKIGRTIFKFLSGRNVEHAYHEEIYRMTTVDGLTQIYNKRYFLDALERELGRVLRYQRDLSLVMFDIDHFKSINDTHGHLAGDNVLRALAGTIQSRIRREDVFARYGGEEFAIVLPEIDKHNGIQFSEKVRHIVETTTFSLEDGKIPVTISMGVAAIAIGGTMDVSAFIKLADEQLYKAKNAGRNCVRG